jgi:hypothetical protein
MGNLEGRKFGSLLSRADGLGFNSSLLLGLESHRRIDFCLVALSTFKSKRHNGLGFLDLLFLR